MHRARFLSHGDSVGLFSLSLIPVFFWMLLRQHPTTAAAQLRLRCLQGCLLEELALLKLPLPNRHFPTMLVRAHRPAGWQTVGFYPSKLQIY